MKYDLMLEHLLQATLQHVRDFVATKRRHLLAAAERALDLACQIEGKTAEDFSDRRSAVARVVIAAMEEAGFAYTGHEEETSQIEELERMFEYSEVIEERDERAEVEELERVLQLT